MASETMKGCFRRSPRWRPHSWECWPATGCSRIKDRWTKALSLTATGLACLGRARSGDRYFPVIKILWTSSYVLMAGGWSLLLLALFYTIIDVLKFRAWAFFFVVIGANAITIYVAGRFIPFEVISGRFFGGVARLSGSFGPLIVPIGTLAIEWLLLLYLYRRKIFLRV